MAKEYPDKLTPLPENQYILSAARAWKRFYGRGPEVKQLACCLAQMILEVGRKKDYATGEYTWGAYCHNYNMGNIKSRDGDGHDFQYYDCGEEVSLAEAYKLDKAKPHLVHIKKIYKWANGSERASIWLKAPHPWCRFRAYETAEEGLVGYIRFLVMERTRYLKAWNDGVMKGDPVTFSMELGHAGYYTADKDRYTKTVVKLFNEFQEKVKNVLATPEGRAIYEGEDDEFWENAMNVVAASVWDHIRELSEEEARDAQTTNEVVDIA